MPCCPPLPLVRSGQANMRVFFARLPPSHPCDRSLASLTPSDSRVPTLLFLFPRETTIQSADVSPSRIASEKIGLAPAPQLLGPAMLQSRELVASSWHGLGRFRVNFIRGLVVRLHRVPA